MAKQQVVLSTCDRCHAEETSKLYGPLHRHDKFILPDGWLHVSGNTRTTLVFEMDLCRNCKIPVLQSAGAA